MSTLPVSQWSHDQLLEEPASKWFGAVVGGRVEAKDLAGFEDSEVGEVAVLLSGIVVSIDAIDGEGGVVADFDKAAARAVFSGLNGDGFDEDVLLEGDFNGFASVDSGGLVALDAEAFWGFDQLAAGCDEFPLEGR